MNWGNGIVMAFVLFAGFIIYMVVAAFNEDFDLVASDYYAKELNYQSKLEQMANLKNSGEKVEVGQQEEGIVITFPEGVKPSNGEVHFYHPSRKLFDKTVPIAIDQNQQQVINSDELVTSLYHVNISWQADGKDFFQQEKLYVQ